MQLVRVTLILHVLTGFYGKSQSSGIILTTVLFLNYHKHGRLKNGNSCLNSRLEQDPYPKPNGEGT